MSENPRDFELPPKGPRKLGIVTAAVTAALMAISANVQSSYASIQDTEGSPSIQSREDNKKAQILRRLQNSLAMFFNDLIKDKKITPEKAQELVKKLDFYIIDSFPKLNNKPSKEIEKTFRNLTALQKYDKIGGNACLVSPIQIDGSSYIIIFYSDRLVAIGYFPAEEMKKGRGNEKALGEFFDTTHFWEEVAKALEQVHNRPQEKKENK